MAERLTLSTPKVQLEKVTAGFEVVAIQLFRRPAAVSVHLLGDHGERIEVRTDTEAEATTVLRALNTANLTIKSLEARAMEWCAGKRPDLAGTVTGTPD